ncbi:hypothetical protein FGB62_119g09 [Gracilaria domingensis]|nr:hypothetical protein FGB62_119g09 [Gracilaria domingensis]
MLLRIVLLVRMKYPWKCRLFAVRVKRNIGAVSELARWCIATTEGIKEIAVTSTFGEVVALDVLRREGARALENACRKAITDSLFVMRRLVDHVWLSRKEGASFALPGVPLHRAMNATGDRGKRNKSSNDTS